MNDQLERLDWEALLRTAARLQGLVPGAVLVGGSAAAAHAGHRISLDADHVLPDLKDRFKELLELLEARPDWTTSRVHAPKLILGDFQGVETGLRQLIRAKPLQTQELEFEGAILRLPTPEEMLRIKGWMVISRNATRDYIDVAAMAQLLGPTRAWSALSSFDECYRDIYRPDAGRDVSPLLQLARQLAEPRPKDLDRVDLANYKGIVPPWTDWAAIVAQCRNLAAAIADGLAPPLNPPP